MNIINVAKLLGYFYLFVESDMRPSKLRSIHGIKNMVIEHLLPARNIPETGLRKRAAEP